MNQVQTFSSESELQEALNNAIALPANWIVTAKGGEFTFIPLPEI